MNKTQLAELCAELVEKGIRKKMARCVRAESTDDRAIALGALRMVHDVCAIGCEKAANGFLESYEYSIDGFSESLREPHCASRKSPKKIPSFYSTSKVRTRGS